MRFDDYTRLPLGTKVDGGAIKVCPECRKNGLAEEHSQKVFYTHLQSFDFNEHGQPHPIWVWHVRVGRAPTLKPLTPPV